ncbi:MAG: lipoyl(octanoyl) transferase LipB [Candidatus Lightella neohaematopini]|nr:lipoyl(octanoyl) transferase LipB [Candidatus Lightella neohaematopini]MCV2528705.1 lipoyl(octanoyl) transferase LipB [Candidatus Lightella neohaematopini]
MQTLTKNRNHSTLDEVWLLQHYPVFTCGYSYDNYKSSICGIPVIKTDRGGKITFHGPGQQIMYVLIDLHRRKISVSYLLYVLNNTVINILKKIGINSYYSKNMPGIYVLKKKFVPLD